MPRIEKAIGWLGLTLLAFSLTIPLYAQKKLEQDVILTQQGVALFKKGEYLKAIRYFKEAFRLVKHPTRLQNIARGYEMLREYHQAIQYYIAYGLTMKTRITNTNQKIMDITLPYLLGNKAIQIKHVEAWLKEMADPALARQFPIVFYIAALTYYKQNQQDKAKALFKKILADPHLKKGNILHTLADQLYHQGNRLLSEQLYNSAEATLGLAIFLLPDYSPKVVKKCLYLGKGFETRNFFDDAIRLYKLAQKMANSQPVKDEIENRIKQTDRQAAKFKLKEKNRRPIDEFKKDLQKGKRLTIAGGTLVGAGVILGGVFLILLVVEDNIGIGDPNHIKAFSLLGVGLGLGAIGLPLLIYGVVLLKRSKQAQTRLPYLAVTPLNAPGKRFHGAQISYKFHF